MSQNVIYVPTIMGEYKIGLIFALIEGLKSGKSLKLVCDNQPYDFEEMLKESEIPNINWSIEKTDASSWQLSISKQQDINSEKVGCCGMCGGHEDSKG